MKPGLCLDLTYLKLLHYQGCTPLHFAAANGHPHIIRILLKYGADPLRTDKHGIRAEDVATEAGYQSVAELLRQAAANYQRPLSPAPSQSPVQASTPPSRSHTLKSHRSIDQPPSISRSSLGSVGSRANVVEGSDSDSTASSGNVPYVEPLSAPEIHHSPERRPSLPTLFEKSKLQRHHRPTSADETSERTRGHHAHTAPIGGTFNPDGGATVALPVRKVPSKYSIANFFRHDPVEPVRRKSSESQTQSRSNSSLSRALDDVFKTPVLPVRSPAPPATRYRGRKSSEVAVSSPLALKPTNASSIESTSTSSSDSTSTGTDTVQRTSRARSISAPGTEPPAAGFDPISPGHYRQSSDRVPTMIRSSSENEVITHSSPLEPAEAAIPLPNPSPSPTDNELLRPVSDGKHHVYLSLGVVISLHYAR